VWQGASAPPESVSWDGKDDRGGAAEGEFTAILAVEWEKGNQTRTESAPFLCTWAAPDLSVQIEPKYFSPDNDGVDDDLFINLSAKSRLPFESWSFEIRDPNDGKRPFWRTAGSERITAQIIWDGRGNMGGAGDFVESAMDYPYIFTVTDTLGLSSMVQGIIPVDVLVIMVGDVLKIRVPSIIFQPNKAVLDDPSPPDLTEAQVANNLRIIKRIAEILNKFKDYAVTLEGHTNNPTSGPIATPTALAGWLSLSQSRAAAVKTQLVKFGVNASRLTTIGKAGNEPIASFGGQEEWKNRRVEFILKK
jgi:hypothetical protein